MGDFPQKYIETIKSRSSKNTRTPSDNAHFVANEIYEYFGKRLAYPRIIGIVSRKGSQATLEILNEVKKAKCRDKIALFVWKCSQMRVYWKE